MEKNKLDEMNHNVKIGTTTKMKLHPKSDIDGLCAFRGKGGKYSILCKAFIVNDENSLGRYVKHHIETFIIAVCASITVPRVNSTQPK